MPNSCLSSNTRRLAAVFIFLGAICLASAQNFYIRAGASGDGSGSDWTNASTTIPTSFVRGTQYYIAGGAYTGNVNLNTPESGTTLISISKATVADHGPGAGWNDAFASTTAVINGSITFGTGYWQIDGKTGADRTGYGIEVFTAGTNHGILLGASLSNITVKYCNVHGYPEGTSRLTLLAGNFFQGIYIPAGGTNLTFQNCYIHHFYGTCFLLRSVNNLLVEYCFLANNASTPAFHSEGISDDGSDNLTIRYNKWVDIDGTAFIACINGTAGSIADTWSIYGNVFWHTGTYGSNVSAVITVIEDASNNVRAKDWKIYNNTFATIQGVVALSFNSPSTVNVQIFNNLFWQNRADAAYINYITFNVAGSGSARDYNFFAKAAFPFGNNNAAHENPIYDGPNSRLSDSPGFVGFVNPTIGDFHLLAPISGFPGIALPATFNQDMDGNTRATDGTWDIGAFENAGGAGTPIAPSNAKVSILVQ